MTVLQFLGLSLSIFLVVRHKNFKWYPLQCPSLNCHLRGDRDGMPEWMSLPEQVHMVSHNMFWTNRPPAALKPNLLVTAKLVYLRRFKETRITWKAALLVRCIQYCEPSSHTPLFHGWQKLASLSMPPVGYAEHVRWRGETVSGWSVSRVFAGSKPTHALGRL